MSTFSGLSIGASGLLSQQAALETVGHNIANATNEGYSRQRVLLSTNTAQERSYGFLGRGVHIQKVERLIDEFVEGELKEAISKYHYLDSLSEIYSQIELYFNELSDNDLSTTMDNFWNSLQELSKNVEDVASRTAVINQAVTLSENFRYLITKLTNIRENLDAKVESMVDTINTYAQEIADLNEKIMKAEAAGSNGKTANDLRDQRDQKIRELHELVGTFTIEHSNSSVSISIGGKYLVYQNMAFTLHTTEQSDNGDIVKYVYWDDDNSLLELSSGELKGVLEARDNVVPNFKDHINDLAANLIWNINKVHSSGNGKEFFSSLTSVYGVDDATVPLNQTNLGFTPKANTYQVKNGSFQIKVKNELTGEIKTTNIQIDLDGIGSDTTLNDLVSMINSVDNISCSLNAQKQIVITQDNQYYTFSFANDTSGVLAYLGLNTLFKGYDATTIEVNPIVLNHPEFLACATTDAPGDNSNVQNMLNLREQDLMSDESMTFDEYYESVVSQLAIEKNRYETLASNQDVTLTNLKNEREAVSGVSLDEEATKMISFQRAYQACAQYISIFNEMLDSLLRI